MTDKKNNRICWRRRVFRTLKRKLRWQPLPPKWRWHCRNAFKNYMNMSKRSMHCLKKTKCKLSCLFQIRFCFMDLFKLYIYTYISIFDIYIYTKNICIYIIQIYKYIHIYIIHIHIYIYIYIIYIWLLTIPSCVQFLCFPRLLEQIKEQSAKMGGLEETINGKYSSGVVNGFSKQNLGPETTKYDS